MNHLGIRLRISVPGGPIVDADSDHLHWIAKYGSQTCDCLCMNCSGCLGT